MISRSGGPARALSGARTAALVHGLALLAGATGLIAQVVWVRQFVHYFGTTNQVVAVVLAIFLGGLALGAFALGRLADAARGALRLAAALLVLSGLAILAGSLAVEPLVAAIDSLGYDSPAASWGQTFTWILLSVMVVLPPAALLGGILPALVVATLAAENESRRRIGLLYGLETIGGAVGSLLAGFVLIRTWGLDGTLWAVAALAVVAGGTIALAARRSAERAPREISPRPSGQANRMPGDRWLLIAAGLAGFAGLGFEIVWLRLLLLVLQSDTYAYTIVAASFLFGIALGSLLARRLSPRRWESLWLFAWSQIAVAGASLLLLMAFGWLSAGAGQRWLASLDGGWAAVVGGRFALCLALLLIPTTMMGMGFPVLASHFLQHLSQVGGRTGQLFSAILMGNVVGVLATGILLVPRLGLQWSLVVLAVFNLAAALLAMAVRYQYFRAAPREAASRWAFRVQAAALAAVLGACAAWQWLWPVGPLGLGSSQEHNILYYREGPVATVAVLEQRDETRVMTVDGVVIGQSQGGVDQKQQVLAHLPFLLRPERQHQRLLTIGLGTGIVAGELARGRGVEHVVCVELSPAVVEGARQFDSLNGNVHANPKVTIVTADGVHYLRRNTTLYDAIVCDAKSRPGHVGNGAFFSSEYYALCRRRLQPGGLMLQWVSLETPPRALRVILRTFTESFPHSYIGIAPPDSLYLVSSDQPLQVDAAAMQRHIESPQAALLRGYGWQNAHDFVALFAADGSAVKQWLAGDEPLNSLARPTLEFMATDMFTTSAGRRKEDNLRALLALAGKASYPLELAGGQGSLDRDCRRSAIRLLEVSLAITAQQEGWFDVAMTALEQGLEQAPQHTRARFLGWELQLEQAAGAEDAGQLARALEHYRQAVRFRPDDVATHRYLARFFRETGDLYQATPHYYEALQLDPEDVALRLEFAYVLSILQRHRHAAEQFQIVLEASPENAQAHLGLGVVLLSRGQVDLARRHVRKAVTLEPSLEAEAANLGIRLTDRE